MTGLTAAGKAKGSDTAPLEMKFGEGVEFTSAVREKLFTFIQHYFNRSIPEKVVLGEERSRVVPVDMRSLYTTAPGCVVLGIF
jgi:hypothetical protein